jgi:tetratricopeptide (TPR) repeat protein
MATNRSLEMIVGETYSNSMKHLQQLIMDADACAKNYGKKTFFGKDKFQPSFDKFMSTIGICVFALVEDDKLDDPENAPEAMKALDLALSRCEETYSSWPLAFRFWQDWYLQFQTKFACDNNVADHFRDPNTVHTHHSLLEPAMSDEIISLVQNYFEQKNFREAIALLTREIARTPNDWNAHYLLGLANRLLGDYEAAARAYATALRINPNEAGIYQAAGINQQKLNNFGDAVRLHRRAIELDPKYVEAHNSLGFTLKTIGQIKEAFDAYQSGASLHMEAVLAELPDQFFKTVMRPDGAKVLQVANEYFSEFRSHLRRNITYAILKNNMAQCLAAMGQVEQATSCFLEAIEFTPEGVDYDDPHIGLRELGAN